MNDVAWERWARENAGLEEELLACEGDPVRELSVYIQRAQGRVTFDKGSDRNHPCTFCGSKDFPRELERIGAYSTGQSIRRPVCTNCHPFVAPRTTLRPVEYAITRGWPDERTGERQ